MVRKLFIPLICIFFLFNNCLSTGENNLPSNQNYEVTITWVNPELNLDGSPCTDLKDVTIWLEYLDEPTIHIYEEIFYLEDFPNNGAGLEMETKFNQFLKEGTVRAGAQASSISGNDSPISYSNWEEVSQRDPSVSLFVTKDVSII